MGTAFKEDISLKDIEAIIRGRERFTEQEKTAFSNPYKNQTSEKLIKPVEMPQQLKLVHYIELMTENEHRSKLDVIFNGSKEDIKEFSKYNELKVGLIDPVDQNLMEWKSLRAENNLDFNFSQIQDGSCCLHVLSGGKSIQSGIYPNIIQMVVQSTALLSELLDQSEISSNVASAKPKAFTLKM